MAWFLNRRQRAVAISMLPTDGPWGGSSPFVVQLAEALRARGIAVRYDLMGRVDAILMIDPREDLQNKAFGPAAISEYKRKYPSVKVLHRINECDQRKGTNSMDSLLSAANRLSDHTVFISEWLRQYFVARWFDPARSNATIYNGADCAIFHPRGQIVYSEGGPCRIVTHHWSSHSMKGFATYALVDNLIADGLLEGFEMWVIGNWPSEIRWRAARTFPPVTGTALASLLRQCHLYLTASLWEPCGMHHVEGAQCGLPVVYHRDGGGIVEAASKYGVPYSEDVRSALVEARTRYHELHKAVLARMPSGQRMCEDYICVLSGMASWAKRERE